ncbi:hypothetical protein E2C01_101305 [Portunus trituberculatus]|uniref:Uncharacterized protein n=1 Tax=Portunus trituberculatus TaxID=210409 RepID=A0A5B7KF99_PORTR|nr:hypothetical protein [Portunus trituberculatus]
MHLLNKISEEDDVFSEVEDYMRLGKYKEGKTRAIKKTLKSQVTAEGLLSNVWKLKDAQETKKKHDRRKGLR